MGGRDGVSRPTGAASSCPLPFGPRAAKFLSASPLLAGTPRPRRGVGGWKEEEEEEGQAVL